MLLRVLWASVYTFTWKLCYCWNQVANDYELCQLCLRTKFRRNWQPSFSRLLIIYSTTNQLATFRKSLISFSSLLHFYSLSLSRSPQLYSLWVMLYTGFTLLWFIMPFQCNCMPYALNSHIGVTSDSMVACTYELHELSTPLIDSSTSWVRGIDFYGNPCCPRKFPSLM